MRRSVIALGIYVLLIASSALAQTNRIDMISPFAPELARFGPYPIGVRTIEAIDRGRIDILNTKAGGAAARYDRRFVLEVWYPATLAAGQQQGGATRVITRDPSVTAILYGRAVRGADPLATAGAFPS